MFWQEIFAFIKVSNWAFKIQILQFAMLYKSWTSHPSEPIIAISFILKVVHFFLSIIGNIYYLVHYFTQFTCNYSSMKWIYYFGGWHWYPLKKSHINCRTYFLCHSWRQDYHFQCKLWWSSYATHVDVKVSSTSSFFLYPMPF